MSLTISELLENGFLLSGLATTLALVSLSIDLVVETTTNVQAAIKKAKEGKDGKKKKDVKDDIEAGTGTVTSSASRPIAGNYSENNSSLLNPNEDDVNDTVVDSTTAQSSSRKLEEGDDRIVSCGARTSLVSVSIHVILLCYFVILCILPSIGTDFYRDTVYTTFPSGAAAITMLIGIIHCVRDWRRSRFGYVQRILFIVYTGVMVLGFIITHYTLKARAPWKLLDCLTLTLLTSYCLLAIMECYVYPIPKKHDGEDSQEGRKATLSKRKILLMLKPYFWPDATSSSAFMNRTRAMLTWVCVASSKVCTLFAPILIGRASTAVIEGNFQSTVKNVCLYALLQFASSFFKESQGLLYLKVAQEAFVQLSEVTFNHLHYLPMEWHLQKKLGEVIRSMDRGISACDTLMKYLFLWLVPAIVESVLVCVIFATYFNYFYLAVSTFYFVFAYIVATIILALRRKKFRQKVNKSDNDWHDKCTESLVNFENVKYFTAEKFETERFIESVKTYQKENVNFQVALSALHVGQQFIFQACLAVSLVLSANAIREGSMEVGDFVAVLSYTINLFQPLNYLARVYNQILTAGIDLQNLSELLALKSDIEDKADAKSLDNVNESSVAIEFEDVKFHYPTQPSTLGLKGVSIQLKRGTTTAIVGTTGAGKTTIGRLLFRFYDVIAGAVRVNGIDVRDLKQKSLRQSIGVVPQTVTMFNDTIKANILYGKRDASDEELEKVCKDAQLWDFVQSLPEGWETVVGDRGLKLSGGEKQRTAIARCLLKDPPIVLLDEATSSLDNVTEKSVKEALDILGSDRTCLIIAHRLGTIRDADKIIVLNDGLVVEEGNHDELLRLKGKYADMWNIQLHSKSEVIIENKRKSYG